MNTASIKRKLRIAYLQAEVAFRWLVYELEAVDDDQFRIAARQYAEAKGRLNKALLADAESRLNDRLM